VSLVRGFKPGEDYLKRYRFNPCGSLLSHIADRLVSFDAYKFEVFCRKLQVAVTDLTNAGILVPGYKIQQRGFWLFPIIVPNKLLFHTFILSKGVNAYRGAT